jgi:hypothetical protein
MKNKENRQVLSIMFAAVVSLGLAPAALAVQIQPFLCAQGADGSNVGFTNVQGQSAIGVTLRESNDQGGGKFVSLSNVKGNSVVNVSTITSATSSNLIIRLRASISTGQSSTMSPSSISGNTYTFNLASGGFNASQTITALAVYAQNTTGSPGTIFLTQFKLNGTNETSHVNSTAGCLGSGLGSPGHGNPHDGGHVGHGRHLLHTILGTIRRKV